MYVHAGNNRMIRTRDIVGIFDMDTATMEQTTRDYLRAAERGRRMVSVKEEIPKAFIVTRGRSDGSDTIYVSPISSGALLGRVNAGIHGSTD